MLRKRYISPRDIFPIDPWCLTATRFDQALAQESMGQIETAFALSNGYPGSRGRLLGLLACSPNSDWICIFVVTPISINATASGRNC